MEVERGGTVHGVPVAALKTLLKRRQGGLSTVDAMSSLGLHEPWATKTMLALARDGYVDYAGRRASVDHWEVGDLGRRLVATRIGTRFPAREARRIADRVVAAARDANADPASPLRITWISLFGSALDAADGDLVGDVDLMVDIRRRKLPIADIKRLRREQLASAPRSYSNPWSPDWSAVLLRRRLMAVSAKVSLMPADTLTLGVRHRPLYGFDVDQEAEVAMTGEVMESRVEADEDAPEGPIATRDEVEPRPWPTDASTRPAYAQGHDQMTLGANLKTQHLWMNGMSVEDISHRLGVPEWAVRSYLSAQTRRREGSLTLAPTLAATLATNLPDHVSVGEASVSWNRGTWSKISITVTNAAAECTASTGRDGLELLGEMELAPDAETAYAAAERWRAKVAPKLKGLEATCALERAAWTKVDAARVAPVVPDFAALRAACARWLVRLEPRAVGGEAHERSVRVTLGEGDGPRFSCFWEEREMHPDAEVLTHASRHHREAIAAGLQWRLELGAEASHIDQADR